MTSPSDISKQLFEVPPDVEFPLELSSTLKSKLQIAVEQNFHLKRHVNYLEKEVLELRKEKLERQCQETAAQKQSQAAAEASESPSIMASKLLQLSKKNRDMTAQIESMKTRMKQLMTQNEKLQADLSTNNNQECDVMSEVTSNQSTNGALKKPDDEASQHQLGIVTNKLMEYRRKCQVLQMELQNALRALSHEVGEGITPQNVLHATNLKSWKGRQQQIIALQQKVADLQSKLSVFTSNADNKSCVDGQVERINAHGEGDNAEILDDSQSVSTGVTNSNRAGIDKQDKKKYEQIRALTNQLETTQQDLLNRQQELKAAKARVQTLESQARSCKSQVEILDAKLREKDHEAQMTWSDLTKIKQELSALKDKDRKNRDEKLLELQEKTRALERERVISERLQEIVNEKQETLQKLDKENVELRSKLGMVGKHISGGLDSLERIKHLESKVRHKSDALYKKDLERQKLLEAASQETNRADIERRNAIHAESQASKIFAVLLEANKCIDNCLEAGQVTSRSVLQEVEHIKTLVRELKAGGDLYCLKIGTKGHPLASKKLELQVNVLNSELQVLRKHMQTLEEQRRNNLGKINLNSEDSKRNFDNLSRIPVLKDRQTPIRSVRSRSGTPAR